MAILPGTQFATVQPSGRTGQTLWGPPPQGEGQDIAEGVQRLGAATLAYALNVAKKEQAAEYYEKKRLIDEAGWAAHNAVTGDDEADKALWEKFQADSQAIANSSKYKDVNDELTAYINQVSPNWQQSMYTTGLKIRSDNAKDQFRLNYEKILENGDMPAAKEMLDKQLALKAITQAEYDELIRTAPAQASIEQAKRLLLSDKPSYRFALEILAAINEKDLTTKQLQEKRSLIAVTEQAKNERADAFDKDTRKKILAGGQILTSLWGEILGNQDISGPQMNTLINLLDSRMDGAGNKYTNAEKATAYAEFIQEKDPEKKIASLFRHVNAYEPESWRRYYDSVANPDDIMNTSFYMELDRQVNSFFGAVDNQNVPKEKIPAFGKMKDDLMEIAKTTGKDYTKAMTQFEALITPVKEEKGRSWLSEWWQDMKDSPILGEGAVHKRKRLAQEREQMFEGDLYGVLVQRYPDRKELILKAKANGWSAEAIAESLK